MAGKFIKQYAKDSLGVDKGGKDKPDEGLKNTDMKYRIEIDEHEKGPGVRIDIYPTDGSERKAIAGEKVKIKFIWNKRNQLNLESDGLTVVNPPVVRAERKLKSWQIVLIAGVSALAVLGIIFLIFHRQIKDWWRKRGNKKEDQLEVF